MKTAEKRPPGRPSKPAAERRRNQLALRIRDELRDDISKAAKENQRSISEEAEYRLERSFADEDDFPNDAIRRWAVEAAQIFNKHGSHAARTKGIPSESWPEAWLADADCYRAAAIGVLESLLRSQPGDLRDVELAFRGMEGRLLTRIVNSKPERTATDGR